MKFRDLTLYLATLLVTILMLFGVRAVQNDLDRQVAQHHLRYTGQIKNAPPLVVISTVALGSFRGIIADLLWLRAESQKQKHNYYEMVQLAQWITDLQPSFSGATSYLAWNMAYNISVTCSSPVDRWRWVNEGLKLLRDKAIVYNPDDYRLYKEIAWIYGHKLGNVMDDANVYYKNRLAVEMQQVFGRFPDWRGMAAAPVGRKAFLEKFGPDHPLWAKLPGDDRDAKYDRLWEDFKKSAPELPPDVFVSEAAGLDYLRAELADKKAFLERYPADSAIWAQLPGNDLDAKYARLREIVKKSPAELPAELNFSGSGVLDHLRAELLRDIYKLDSRKILKINEEYGTLDWRTPEAQAIYWARESIAHSLDIQNKREINTDRIITNALYQSFLAGRIMKTDPDLNKVNDINFMTFPNLSLVDAVFRIYTAGQDYHDSDYKFQSSFRTARNNFLKEAIYLLYTYGAYSKAEEYYQLLVKDDGPQKQLLPNGQVVVFHSLAEFAKAEWVETIKSSNAKQADSFLFGLLYSSIIHKLSGDHDTAVMYERTARYVYKYYAEVIGNTARMEIPPYDDLKYQIQLWCLEVLPPDQALRLKSIIEEERAERLQRQRMERAGTVRTDGDRRDAAPAAAPGR